MNSKNCYLGIDPGKNGGLALLDSAGEILFRDRPKPLPAAYLDALKACILIAESRQEMLIALIERTGSRPAEGSSSAHNFGIVSGWWHGILTALDVAWQQVLPQIWTRDLPSLGEEIDNKTRSILTVKDRFGIELKAAENGVADALLIADYLRKVHQQAPGKVLCDLPLVGKKPKPKPARKGKKTTSKPARKALKKTVPVAAAETCLSAPVVPPPTPACTARLFFGKNAQKPGLSKTV